MSFLNLRIKGLSIVYTNKKLHITYRKDTESIPEDLHQVSSGYRDPHTHGHPSQTFEHWSL